VKNTHLRAERGRARRPRKRRSRFVRGFCNAGAAAACARASVQPLARCGPAPVKEEMHVRIGRPRPRRARYRRRLCFCANFFFEESVGRVVHERLRALVPALGGVYGLAGARGPPQAKHARGGAAGSRRRDRPARQAAHVCKRSYHGWHARWGRFRAPTASPSRPFGPATRVVEFASQKQRTRARRRARNILLGGHFSLGAICT